MCPSRARVPLVQNASMAPGVAAALLLAVVAWWVKDFVHRLFRNYCYYAYFHDPDKKKNKYKKPPLRMGLLGAAKIAPFALMHPAKLLHEDVTVVAVGARDVARAEIFARRWGIPAHGDYKSVLSNPNVDAGTFFTAPQSSLPA